jgi:hypothetical protein
MSIVALFVLAASLISFEVSGAHAPPANDD